MTSQLRPCASETDKAIFTDLLNKISEADSYFCCGGTIDFDNRPLNLYYKFKEDPNIQTINCLEFLLSRDPGQFKIAVDQLVKACVPAPHGRGNQTVYDDSYRLARELSLGEFSLSLDILSEAGAGVLSTISELVSGRCHYLPKAKAAASVDDKRHHKSSTTEDKPLSLKVEPRLYKLNAYSKDGFFKPHRDTPKGSKHAGTLLMGLPVAFEGGALRVSHAGKEVKFDWGFQCSQGILFTGENDYKISIPWAFFFSDVEHEVYPVLSGSRVTIAYDIFASQTTPESNIDTNIRTFPISDEISSALQSPNFLPDGAHVAIALSHAYSLPRRALTKEELASNLKGTDAILYRDLISLGLDISLKAVYELSVRDSPVYLNSRSNIPEDGYGPTKLRKDRRDDGRTYISDVYYTSDVLAYITDYNDYFGQEFNYKDFLENSLKAKFAGDLMWVKKPTRTFTEAGSYVAYSNQSSPENCYAAITFVITIPPYGEGPRTRV